MSLCCYARFRHETASVEALQGLIRTEFSCPVSTHALIALQALGYLWALDASALYEIGKELAALCSNYTLQLSPTALAKSHWQFDMKEMKFPPALGNKLPHNLYHLIEKAAKDPWRQSTVILTIKTMLSISAMLIIRQGPTADATTLNNFIGFIGDAVALPLEDEEQARVIAENPAIYRTLCAHPFQLYSYLQFYTEYGESFENLGIDPGEIFTHLTPPGGPDLFLDFLLMLHTESRKPYNTDVKEALFAFHLVPGAAAYLARSLLKFYPNRGFSDYLYGQLVAISEGLLWVKYYPQYAPSAGLFAVEYVKALSKDLLTNRRVTEPIFELIDDKNLPPFIKLRLFEAFIRKGARTHCPPESLNVLAEASEFEQLCHLFHQEKPLNRVSIRLNVIDEWKSKEAIDKDIATAREIFYGDPAEVFALIVFQCEELIEFPPACPPSDK